MSSCKGLNVVVYMYNLGDKNLILLMVGWFN